MARDNRRLAAIVSADVAGYSRLMGRDDSDTVARLQALAEPGGICASRVVRDQVLDKLSAGGVRFHSARSGDGLICLKADAQRRSRVEANDYLALQFANNWRMVFSVAGLAD